MKRAMVIAAAIVLTLLMPSTLVGWGSEGHEIVASLAETRLTENVKRGIRSLIGDASLVSIANRADEVRPERDETYNWQRCDKELAEHDVHLLRYLFSVRPASAAVTPVSCRFFFCSSSNVRIAALSFLLAALTVWMRAL